MTEPRGPVVAPGETVEGRYRVIKPLDEGGMGTVWLAEHVLIKRRVAIKFLRPELATDPDVIERFMNEARAAGTLGHPNIVESTDMGFTRDEVPYIVFEYLEGSLLVDEIYRSKGLRVPRAIRIAYQIASALQAAHNAHIVHRDLKSENIFLTFREDTSGDHVKVLDFGISRFQEAEAESSKLGRGNRTVVGTPEFMAPEQITSPESVDKRADIYALGVILYEMVAARRPFPKTGELEELLRRVVSEPPPPLDVPAAPPGLSEMITEKLLAKDPDQRYQSMKDVQSALEAFHTIARPTGSLTPLSIPVPEDLQVSPAKVVSLAEPKRKRSGVLFLVAAVLAGGAGVALSVAEPGPAPYTADTAAAAALRGDGGQLAQSVQAAVRAAQMRAEAMASTPMLRAAIETDAATLQDMAKTEHLFSPAKGDVIQVFQDRGGKNTLLLRLPEAGTSIPDLPAGHARVSSDATGLSLLVSSAVTNQSGKPSGTLEIASPLDLSGIAHAVSGRALDATLVGLGTPIVLAHGGDAPRAPVDHLAIPVAVPSDLAPGPVTLDATVPRQKSPERGHGLRTARLASWGIGGILLLMYAGSLLMARRQR